MKSNTRPERAKLDRRRVVARLLDGRREILAIAGLGSSTYDLAAAGDHERNFYLWGAMGGASLMGLGVALAQPGIPVLVITGDGEALMGMGGFATIAAQNPRNLAIVILDNGLYGETGAQLTHTVMGVDLAAVAAACGIADTRVIDSMADVEALAERIHVLGAGPVIAVIKIDGAAKPRHLPSRDGVWLKARFRAALGFTSM